MTQNNTIFGRLYKKLEKTKLGIGLRRIFIGDIEYQLFRINQYNISTAILHQKTFGPFKNLYAGKDVAIIACGPSLNDYQDIPGVIKIGVNRAIRKPNINLDYLFLNDGGSTFSREEMDEFNNYNVGKCQKFYGLFPRQDHLADLIISESDAIKANALRYHMDMLPNIFGWQSEFTLDIGTQTLGGLGTVVMSALQFAMWTNPRRLFLVGCDCSSGGAHFYKDTKPQFLDTAPLIERYKEFKRFAHIYYPDTEIISVNPVGLKGLFKDWNQKDGEPMPE